MAPPNTTDSGSKDPSTKMTKIQAQKVIEENKKMRLREQIKSALEEIKSEEESSDHTTQPVSLDFMVTDREISGKNIVEEIASSKDFYQNLYVVSTGHSKGFWGRLAWASDFVSQISLRDSLVSSLVKNGGELYKLNERKISLTSKIPYMKAILVTIDKLQKNNMIHGEGVKKLEVLRQYLQGKYDKWEKNLLKNLDKDSRSPDNKKIYMEYVLETIDILQSINSNPGDDEQLASLKKGVQDKYDTLKNKSTNNLSFNKHGHVPELNKLLAPVKEQRNSTHNRHDELHKVDPHNPGSQKENSNSNSNLNHLPGHKP